MIRHLRRMLQLLLLGTLAAALAGPAVAAPAPQTTEIALSARPAYDGAFRAGTWLPIVIDLENAGRDRTVQVRVGSREGAQYAAEVELPNSGRKSITVYAYMTPASRRLLVRLLDGEEELASQTLQLTPANNRARIVGVVSGQGATVRPPARLDDGLSLVTVPLASTDLPEHPLGLSGISTLVLEDIATADLSHGQRAAIEGWVLRGGQLILSGGTGLERSLAGLPESLRPAVVSAVEPVPAVSLFGEASTGAAEVPLARLAPVAGAGRAPYLVPIAALATASSPAIEQSLGRGAVLALTMPLSHPALTAWEGSARLWEELLRPSLELPPGFAPDMMTMDSFIEGNLASTLTSLPALEFPPLGLLAGLVAAYIILVGPVTFLVLRRLDRQALGWAVVPVITLVFAALTYSLGYAQRGGDIVFNQVTLIEPGAGPEARARTFIGLFSPERRAYTLQVSDAADAPPLLRPISVQGPWDTSSPGAGVYMQDAGPGAEARGFDVAQWSMRAVAADSTAPIGSVESRVVVSGNELTGEVTNSSGQTLRDVTLIQGDRVLRLGDMAPGETKGGPLQRRQSGQPGAFGPTVPVSYLVYGEEMDRQSRAGGQPLPPEIQQRIRILDALFNYGPSSRGGQPLLLAWADTTALDVLPLDQRADQQHVALVSLAPRIELSEGEVTLPQGWLAPRFEGGVTSVCFGGLGSGVTMGAQPATIQLQLPRDLYGLRPSEMTLITGSDGPWSSEIILELYDWASGSWVTQDTSMRNIAVPSPERFVGSHGTVRVRLSSEQLLMNIGCVYVDAKIRGTMP